MPSGGGGTYCQGGVWTTVYQGPTFGFTYLWSLSGNVTVQWRRYSSGFPWYMDGSVNLSGSKTTLVHGGPAFYLHLEIRPPNDISVTAS